MNSSQQPPEFIKDPEETDDDAYRLHQALADIYKDNQSPTLSQAIRDAWEKSKDKRTPEQERVLNDFLSDIKKPRTWIEYGAIFTAIGVMKRKRNWGKTKTVLAFLAVNETWSFIEDPAKWKRAYKAAIHR